MAGLIHWDVDTQYDFMISDGKLYVPGAEEIIPSLEALRDHARRAGIRTVASADDHVDEHEEISDSPDLKLTFPPHCMRGTVGQTRIPETALDDPVVIEPIAMTDDDLDAALAGGRDLLINKHHFDVFTNPNTEPLVHRLAPGRIVLFGVALDVCSRFAVEGLLARFPEVALSVVPEGMRALDPDRGAELIRDWERRGVEVLPLTHAMNLQP